MTQDALASFADIARHHARERGERTAVVFGDRQTSYAEYDRRASQAANGLLAAGVRPQSRVAFIAKNSDWVLEALGGAAKANAVTVAVNWRLAPPEIAYVVNDSHAEVLFVGPDFADAVQQVRNELPKVKTIVSMGEGHPEWQDFASWRDAQSDSDPLVPCSPEDVTLQMYTSGTTGHPKGVQLASRGIQAAFDSFTSLRTPWAEWTPEDVNLVVLPMFHIAGLGGAATGLYAGAKNVLLSDFDPGVVLETIQQHAVTKLTLVPAAIQILMLNPKCGETDFSSLRYMTYGASPIPLDVLQRAMKAFQCEFVQAYGMTETSGLGTYLPPEDHDIAGNERMRSAGKPMPGIQIKVVDSEGNALPAGQVGEVCLRSATNMIGYWNLPEASEKTLVDGWLHTGDAGYLDADGYLFIQDRVKDMIVSGGENIYPAEVENALFGHPALADVAVIGVPDDRWGEAVKAVVVLKEGASATEAELIAHTKERIAAFKVPKSVDFIPLLPRNLSGKVLKKELREPYWKGRERRVN